MNSWNCCERSLFQYPTTPVRTDTSVTSKADDFDLERHGRRVWALGGDGRLNAVRGLFLDGHFQVI